jgi:hypothetical protein
MMSSGGFRLAAWDYFKWIYVVPLTNSNLHKSSDESIIAAKLTTYSEDNEQYFTFIASEAYYALKDWIDFRTSYGETITGDSWLMRDIWQTTNHSYGARWGLATNPKKLSSRALKRFLDRALWEQGIWHLLPAGAKRQEWKCSHGFRKRFKTQCELAGMKSINIDTLMGHSTVISHSYYRATPVELLQDCLRAIPSLAINYDTEILRKQIDEETVSSL